MYTEPVDHIPSERRYVFATEAQLERARQRIEEFNWARVCFTAFKVRPTLG